MARGASRRTILKYAPNSDGQQRAHLNCAPDERRRPPPPAGPSSAASFNTTFSTDPGGTAIGSAEIENGVLKLTDLADLPPADPEKPLPQNDSYIFADFNGGAAIQSLPRRSRLQSVAAALWEPRGLASCSRMISRIKPRSARAALPPTTARASARV